MIYTAALKFLYKKGKSEPEKSLFFKMEIFYRLIPDIIAEWTNTRICYISFNNKREMLNNISLFTAS
ncbi:MAG TPA: hypothetical protein DDX98_02240 [Bacteroidales bacterium]|nr:hypothetical protein [Bacteroidales bacterium]